MSGKEESENLNKARAKYDIHKVCIAFFNISLAAFSIIVLAILFHFFPPGAFILAPIILGAMIAIFGLEMLVMLIFTIKKYGGIKETWNIFTRCIKESFSEGSEIIKNIPMSISLTIANSSWSEKNVKDYFKKKLEVQQKNGNLQIEVRETYEGYVYIIKNLTQELQNKIKTKVELLVKQNKIFEGFKIEVLDECTDKNSAVTKNIFRFLKSSNNQKANGTKDSLNFNMDVLLTKEMYCKIIPNQLA